MARTAEVSPALRTAVKGLVGGTERRARRLVLAGVSVTVVAGVALRFFCPSPLWLDEALSVNIAKLPLSHIPAALRQDGAPPLYYVLLHFWMLVFGEGNIAVRALSGVASVAALPAFWFAGRRVGGERVAWITFFLALSSPFAIYYATDTRMYSLMILVSVLAFLALCRALEESSTKRLVVLGLAAAGLLYTHYWGLFLVSVTGIWLLYQVWRHRRGLPASVGRAAATRAFVAMLLGSLLFVPWAPIFVFQTFHTGTPWSSSAGPADLLATFDDFSGTGPWALLLSFAYFSLVVLGVFGRRAPAAGDAAAPGTSAPDGVAPAGVAPAGLAPHGAALDADRAGRRRLDGDGRDDLEARGLRDPTHARAGGVRGVLDRLVGFAGYGPGGAGAAARRTEPGRGITLVLQPNRRALPIFGVMVGTLVLAVLGGLVANAAYVARYAAVVLPLFLLVVALGVSVLSRPRLVGGALCVLCVAGLLTGYGNNGDQRTEASQVAQVLNAEAKPGDLVLYCPDQLGPDASRLITVPGLKQLTFPRAIGPARVDWIDYRATVAHTNPEAFAQQMLGQVAPGHTIWLVWRNGYAGLGSDCGDLASWLSLMQGRGVNVLDAQPSTYYEYENLTRYPTS